MGCCLNDSLRRLRLARGTFASPVAPHFDIFLEEVDIISYSSRQDTKAFLCLYISLFLGDGNQDLTFLKGYFRVSNRNVSA